MSICRSFVDSIGLLLASNQIVCKLLQSICRFSSRLNLRALNSLCHQRASFVAVESAKSSTSVLEVVIVDCFVAFHAIGPP